MTLYKAAPNDCNMVLVHDDDLEKLGGIYDSETVSQSPMQQDIVLILPYFQPLDSLNKDIVLDNIRSLKPTLDYNLSQIGETIQIRHFLLLTAKVPTRKIGRPLVENPFG
jgi:hypothetical protein